MAAEEESPAPIGMSLAIAPSHPASEWPASVNAHATPWT